MKKAQVGNTVVINYSGKLKDGKEVLASPDNRPVNFKLGHDEIIKGVQDALVGMQKGESKTITLAPDEAFGQHQEKNIIELDKNRLSEPARNNLQEGRNLELINSHGEKVIARVNKITDDKVILDTNHFLAGKEIIFDITLLEIK
jgi:peptidylprolyl isomerase